MPVLRKGMICNKNHLRSYAEYCQIKTISSKNQFKVVENIDLSYSS